MAVVSVVAKADVLVWRCDRMNMTGWTDSVAAVVLHANIGDIEHVMVDGRWRKRDGGVSAAAERAGEGQRAVSGERRQVAEDLGGDSTARAGGQVLLHVQVWRAGEGGVSYGRGCWRSGDVSKAQNGV